MSRAAPAPALIRQSPRRQDALDRAHPPGCVSSQEASVSPTTSGPLAFPGNPQGSAPEGAEPMLAVSREQRNVNGMTAAVAITPESDDLEPVVIMEDELATAGASDRPDIDARLLHDVIAYAQARLAAGDGSAALRLIGADHPALVAAYQLGYLSRAWQSALGSVARRACTGRRLADTLVLPAYDAQGAVVDLFAIHARAQGGAYVGLHDPPRGLLAPRLATAHTALTVTDSLRIVARRFAAGHTDALLLRGPTDAQANASRLAAAGVQRVLVRTRNNAEPIAAALRSAGIAVAVVSAHEQSDDVGYDAALPPSPPPRGSGHEDDADLIGAGDHIGNTHLLPDDDIPVVSAAVQLAAAPSPPSTPANALTLVSHDQQAERATFTIGSVTYVVEVPHDESMTRIDLVTRHAGHVHREVVDLAVDAARNRYAGNAALRCGVAAPVIAAHLPLLLGAVQTLRAVAETKPDDGAVDVPDGAERDAALTMLRSPTLLGQLTADLTTLGWVGEDTAKQVLLLTAISRKLPEPLWAIRTASREITGSHGLDLIAALMPPEDLIHVSRLTNAALAYQNAHALHHKLLVIDDATTLSPEVILALRVLKQRGALSQAVVPRHNLSGSARTQTIEVRGPIAVVSATAGRLDDALTASCCLVPVDESADQTARVLAAERVRYAQPGGGCDAVTRTAIIQRHHTLNRLIVRRPVVIPFADRIQFPATTLRSRHEQARFLGLIAASALLHQYLRLTDRGHVVADERDFTRTVSLAEAAGIGAEPELGRPATVLLHALHHTGITTFTSDSALALLPHWGRTSFRSAVADLLRLDYVVSPEGGRGQRRSYSLIAGQQPASRPVITLRPVTTEAELVSWSVVGQFATDQLNSSPRAEIDAVG